MPVVHNSRNAPKRTTKDVRYEGDSGEEDLEMTETILSSSSKSPLHGVRSTLLEWHELDPVDDFERNRNDVIYSYQGNRNPFIDHPELVDYIWGDQQQAAWNSLIHKVSVVPTSLDPVESDDG